MSESDVFVIIFIVSIVHEIIWIPLGLYWTWWYNYGRKKKNNYTKEKR